MVRKVVIWSIFCLILLASAAFFVGTSWAYNEAYATQISIASGDNSCPNVNNNGVIVWRNNSIIYQRDTDGQINLRGSVGNCEPHINNNGQLVYEYNADIYCANWFFTSTQRITYESNYYNPCINDNKDIVWQQNGEIWIRVYNSGDRLYIGRGKNPRINNKGHVVYEFNGDIFYYNGYSVERLTFDMFLIYLNHDPDINDNDEIVWEHYGDIHLKSNGNTIVINNKGTTPNCSTNNYRPRINNNGQVVWYGYNGYANHIFLYSNGTTGVYTSINSDHRDPEINDNGKIVWRIDKGSGFQIYLNTNTPPPPPPLNDALDNHDLTFSSHGYGAWFPQNSVSFFGGSSAQVKYTYTETPIWIETQVLGPGTLYWYAKIDGNTTYYGDQDWLSLTVDGYIEWNGIGSSPAWSKGRSWAQYSVSIPSGTHKVQWKYQKGRWTPTNWSAWVDKVEYTTPAKISVNPSSLLGQCARGKNPAKITPLRYGIPASSLLNSITQLLATSPGLAVLRVAGPLLSRITPSRLITLPVNCPLGLIAPIFL